MSDNQEPIQPSGASNSNQGSDPVSNEFGTLDQLSLPEISLPKGGGAIRGIDSQFQVNSANGTSNVSIPLPISPGRNGFQPNLSLNYNSGSGNSTFGLGWDLSLASIQRKTDKKIPQYNSEDPDTYSFSGLEDLVISHQQSGSNWIKEEVMFDQGSVILYRPRVESDFAKIEQITHNERGIYWKVTSKENIVTFYGLNTDSRIKDPEDNTRIFRWLPDFSYDNRGNWIRHRYKEEDTDGMAQNVYDQNRVNGLAPFTNIYLKEIAYGNKEAYYNSSDYDPDPIVNEEHHFDLIFDYGEHDQENPRIDDTGSWNYRDDSFSTYNSGFEIRTCRLCQRVLMFHNFQELGNVESLVRSLDLQFNNTSNEIFKNIYLIAVTLTGYEKLEDGSYKSKSLPPMEYEYQELDWNNQVKIVDPENSANTPVGLTNNYTWVDLYGEGISGILAEQDNTWYYRSNLGSYNDDQQFGPLKEIKSKPSFSGIKEGLVSIQDIESNGTKQLVVHSKEIQGYFQIADKEDEGFRPFLNLPNINLADPNLRQIDLNGDGKPELVIANEEIFIWYESLGVEGFEGVQHARHPFDEEEGPRLIFGDGEERIFLADMSGDGLTDIVRINNGQVCYWANKGYGRFSAKITMGNSPWFDHPDQFHIPNVHLADISGSGTTDLIYITDSYFKAYVNISGNFFSEPQHMKCTLPMHQHAKISVIDFLGTGTSCIVWSSDLSESPNRNFRYIDLLSSRKPHVMTSMKNNMGKETHFSYKSSTYYYQMDQRSSRPWLTKLPFPVQVIDQVIVQDLISKAELITTYRYHHGYYDSVEREFRGFAMTEQIDAESFDNYNVESDLDIPHTLTKTWFHTGALINDHDLTIALKNEFYQDGYNSYEFPDQILEQRVHLSTSELHQAYRSFKGLALRQEIYSMDNSDKSDIPYAVSMSNFITKRLQPELHQSQACFYVSPQESISFSYERNVLDPRVNHSLILETDNYGNVLKSADVAYPRRGGTDEAYPEQFELHVTVRTASISNITLSGHYLGLPLSRSLFEIQGLDLAVDQYFSWEDLTDQLTGVLEASKLLRHDQSFSSGVQAKILGLVNHFYYSDSNEATFGHVSLPVRPHHEEQIVMSDSYTELVFEDLLSNDQLAELGYYQKEDHWWKSGATALYMDANQFYLPHQSIDPFNNPSRVYYDDYNLLPIKSEDVLGNYVVATPDYRTLTTKKLVDINENITETLTDPLGSVIATSVYGEINNENKGDRPISSYTVLDDASLENILSNPHDYLQDATSFFYYDVENWQINEQPPTFVQLSRQTHVSELNESDDTLVHVELGYSDGFGRELQSKTRITDSSWLVSGRKVYNNKELPIKQYEPFFSDTYRYQSEQEIAPFGVSPIIFYDPLGRKVKTETPDGFYSYVNFDPWQVTTYDKNDTVKDSQAYSMYSELIGTGETRGIMLEKAIAHYDTPTIVILDSLGREFMTIQKQSDDLDDLFTYTEFNLQGNPLTVTDSRQYEKNKTRGDSDQKNNFVYKYDLTGNILSTRSLDAGHSLSFANVIGNTIYAWNAGGYKLTTLYDKLSRPVSITVNGHDLNHVIQKIEYGTDKSKNQNGQVITAYDQAGKIENQLFDLKGQLLKSTQQLRSDYKTEANWVDHESVEMEIEVYTTELNYDALGNIVGAVQPDGSRHRLRYYTTGWLKSVNVQLREQVFGSLSSQTTKAIVQHIDYNARGQRTRIEYDNHVSTDYTYDNNTFRLTNLITARIENSGSQSVLQDISYVYDPSGNILQINDNSHNKVFTSGQVVNSEMNFVYDALYQLKEASGREHLALSKTAYQQKGELFKVSHFASLNDANQLRNYVQQYTYNKSGNLTQIKHTGENPFTRNIKVSEESNRAITDEMDDSVDVESYFDASGNMLSLEHLRTIEWNYRNNIASVTLIERDSENDSEYYVYDGNGKRLRKVKETFDREGNLLWLEEKIYLEGVEIKKKFQGNSRALREARTALHIMDDQRRIAIAYYWEMSNDSSISVDLNKVHYQLGNHLGSASLELNETGRLISYEEYFPFGGTAFTTGTSLSEVKLKEYRYTGKERDDTTGLYYYGARYYAPWMCRWLNPDPGGTIDGLNLFRFVRNNPLRLVDNNGLLSFEWNDEEAVNEIYTHTFERQDDDTYKDDSMFANAPDNNWDDIEIPKPFFEMVRAGEIAPGGYVYFIEGGRDAYISVREGPGDTLEVEMMWGMSEERADYNSDLEFEHALMFNEGWAYYLLSEQQTVYQAYRSIRVLNQESLNEALIAAITTLGGYGGKYPAARPSSGARAVTTARAVSRSNSAYKTGQGAQNALPSSRQVNSSASSAGASTASKGATAGSSYTPVTLTKRWKVGDPHDALKKGGIEPSWSTVRSRYWKNRAASAPAGEFTPANLERMRKGKAPIDAVSGRPIELEHVIPQRTGNPGRHRALMEVTPLEHAFFDKYRHASDLDGNTWMYSHLDPR